MEHKYNDFDESSSFDYKEWLKKILRYWYVMVVAVVMAAGCAYLTNRKWKPQYRVEAKVILGDNNQKSSYAFMQGFNSDMLNSNNDQLILFGRDELVRRAIADLPLGVEYFTQGRFKRNYFYKHLAPIQVEGAQVSPAAYELEFCFTEGTDSAYTIFLEDAEGQVVFSQSGRFGEEISTPYFSGVIQKRTSAYIPKMYIKFRSEDSLQEEFSQRLFFSLLDGTSVAVVSLVGEQVERDIDFINALSEEFVKDNLDRKNLEANRTIAFIDDQLLLMSDSLAASNARIHAFRKDNQIVNFDDYMSGLLTQSADYKNKEIELGVKETYFNYLDDYLKRGVQAETILAPSSLGISDPLLMDLVNQINELQLKRSTIGEQNPYYSKYTSELATLRNTLVEVLKNIRTIYEMDRRNFEKQSSKVAREIESLSGKESEIVEVERHHQINNNYYTYLLQKRSEAQIRMASNVSDITILQGAKVVSFVNGKVKKSTYLKYLLIGLVLSIVLIVLKELLDNTVKTTGELEKISKFTVLGEIPHFAMRGKVITTHYLKSSFTEAFRVLKTRVEFITKKKEGVVLCVSSCDSGDGKSYFSINLAGIYSLQGKRTLLIDLDLRKPDVANILQIACGKGISNVLIGDCELEEAIVRGGEFDFLPAGSVPPNPSELLSSERALEVIADLRAKYDYIVLDTSPIGLVSDCYPITGVSDVNFFVTLSGKTSKTHVKEVSALLKKDGIKNVYAVLNGVKQRKSKWWCKKYQRKSYYYTEHYFDGEENKKA